MNHDITHCADFDYRKCPKQCEKAKEVIDLRQRNDLWWLPVSWAHMVDTDVCERKE